MKSSHFWIVRLQIIFIFLVMYLTVFKILMMTSPSYSQKKVLFQTLRTHSFFSLHSELNAKSKELHLQISEDGQSSEGGWRAGGRRPCPLEGPSSALTRAVGSWGGRETQRRPAPPHTIWVSPGNVWLKVHSVINKVHFGKEYIQIVFLVCFFLFNKYPKSFI